MFVFTPSNGVSRLRNVTGTLFLLCRVNCTRSASSELVKSTVGVTWGNENVTLRCDHAGQALTVLSSTDAAWQG